MNVLSLHSTTHPLHFSTISCFYKPPKTTPLFSATKTLPARDRFIDFGKFKGKMLGTLPSTYLKWVSKNLRARDSEEWAKLADEVLNDPVYKDRIEWEFAEKLLHGDVKVTHNDAVSELLEISERFGWDNEDKVAWRKIDFKLLGTSKGGRIPRVHENRSVTEIASLHAERTKVPKVRESRRRVVKTSSMNVEMTRISRVYENRKIVKATSLDGGDVTGLRASQSYNLSHNNKNAERKMGYSKKDEVRVCDNEVEERRKERRERLRLTRSSSSSSSNGSPIKRSMERMEKMGIEDDDKGRFGILENIRLKGKQDIDEDRVVEVQSPFPGREALLKKVLSRRKL